MKLAILGAGAWGTALAVHFSRCHDVGLWSANPTYALRLQACRYNENYLPGIIFPDALRIEYDLQQAVYAADLAVIATPIAGLRPTLVRLSNMNCSVPLLWVCKGLEADSMKLPHQVADEEMDPMISRGMISGPSFAEEVARGLPTAVTIAATDLDFARSVAHKLNSTTLRLYASQDLIGVEIGAAVKNVLAIAAGICDGKNLGYNARAALLTRGLAEMARFGAALGADVKTFMGLSGVGDLMLTATSDLSRNRRVGLMLAQGMRLDDILKQLGHVAEGVSTTKEIYLQAKKVNIDMPITTAVYQILFADIAVEEIIGGLMGRLPRMEAGD